MHILDKIIIKQDDYNSENLTTIITSNINYLNTLFDNHILASEVCHEALISYYLDYFLFEMKDGGFSQFIYNIENDETMINLIKEGLELINAKNNLEIFSWNLEALSNLKKDDIVDFLNSEMFSENEIKNILDKNNNQFYELQEYESIEGLNAIWMKNHKKTIMLNEKELASHIQKIIQSIPNINKRKKPEPDISLFS